MPGLGPERPNHHLTPAIAALLTSSPPPTRRRTAPAIPATWAIVDSAVPVQRLSDAPVTASARYPDLHIVLWEWSLARSDDSVTDPHQVLHPVGGMAER